MRNLTTPGLVAFGLLWSLVPAFTSAKPSPAKPIHTLRIRTLGDPLTLDWNRAFSPVEAILIRNLMEGLVAIGPKMKLLPALAASWKITDGGKRYVFQLRKNVKWSDGAPLKASQFVDSWKRLLSPSFKGNYAYLLFDVENAEPFHKGEIQDFSLVGVKAIADDALEVRLRAPVAYWIWIPTFWSTFPIRSDLIEKHAAEWDRPGKLVGLGPFSLESYEPRRKVVLARNPSYYGSRGNVDQIVSALIEDEATAVDMYEDNQLDFMTRLSVEARRLKGRKDFRTWQEARVVHLDFNPDQAPTNDPALRRAIAHAIDRSTLAQLLEGAERPATSLVTPGILGHSDEEPFPFDPEKARAIFEKAGYLARPPLSLDLVIASFNDEVLTANFIKEQLKKILGIQVRIQKLEPKQFYSPLVKVGGFSMLLNRWTADYPDPDNFFSIFISDAGNNRVGWRNAEYDALVKKARGEQTASDRVKLYQQAHRLLVQDGAIAVPLYYGKNCALIRTNISGFEPTPTNSWLFKDFKIK